MNISQHAIDLERAATEIAETEDEQRISQFSHCIDLEYQENEINQEELLYIRSALYARLSHQI